MNHVVVHAEKGNFAGWPANNGLWVWDGLEILVGLTVGGYVPQKGHNIRQPYANVLARSLDGGETWATERPAHFVGAAASAIEVPAPLDLTNRDLAMRMVGTGYHGSDEDRGCFFCSVDRGTGWEGPFSFGRLLDDESLRGKELTCRTDYLVSSTREGLFFMSARKPGNWADEKVFCARTIDGCQTFQFVSWVVANTDPFRAVMPSTVRCGFSKLVSAIRRREMGTDRCWIDAYGSTDNGRRWSFLSTVAATGPENGNPPAMVRMDEGRLCCVYGNREFQRIEARISQDQGETWRESVVLRDDFQADVFGDADLGYPRVAQRVDGKLVACYYWATEQLAQQHIAATIWDPDVEP